MIILNTTWLPSGNLAIWVESLELFEQFLAKRETQKNKLANKGNKKQQTEILEHPFVCSTNSILEIISSSFQIDKKLLDPENKILSSRLLAKKTADGNKDNNTLVKLSLPTADNLPQPSHPLFRDLIPEHKPKELSAWQVPSLEVKTDLALDLLLSLPTKAPSGIIFSDSLLFFSELAKFALKLVVQGKVLPALEKRQDSFFARWKPVVNTDVELLQAKQLMELMPLSLCWIIGTPKPSTTITTIFQLTLESLVDGLVRKTLSGTKFFTSSKKYSSAHQEWLIALLSEPEITTDKTELNALYKVINHWHNSAFRATGQLRTCFRLSEPPSETKFVEIKRTTKKNTKKIAEESELKKELNLQTTNEWKIDFLLQAIDDKSLLVPAEIVWKTKGKVLKFSSRDFESPQERLLTDLGKSIRLYPELESALKVAKPVSLSLDTTGAYKFLREIMPLLEQSGFGVLVPSWYGRPLLRPGAKLTAQPTKGKATGSNLLGLEGICDYQWKLAIGEEEISYEDFLKLAKLKVPLVQIRGQWVELKSEEIQAAIAFFEKKHLSGEMTVNEVLRVGLGLEGEKLGVPVVGFETSGWLKEFLAENNEQKLTEQKAPKGFVGKLRPYQERGLSWLNFLNNLGIGACLADDMGLGKTVQLLALLVLERQNSNKKQNPTLLVCPMSVVGNWQREASRFAPSLKVQIHHGAERLTDKEFVEEAQKADLVITTYGLATRDQSLLSEVTWARVVLDEAQNIKNPDAKQTKAIRSLKSQSRIALTGTPVENRLSELWSIMEFLNPGLLGSASNFSKQFSTPIERYRSKEKATLLKQLTQPFILRRLKTDKKIIQDLPEKIEMKTFCNLTSEQASLYQAVVDEMMQKIEKSEEKSIERKGIVLATLMKLKQVCNHPVQMLQDGSSVAERSGKLARLEEIIEEILDAGDKVLCFSQFAEMGKMLKSHLQEKFGCEILFLQGATTKKARDEMVERFQSANGPAIFILSLKAGGVGLNLTAAQHVIHFDRWWNPAVEAQATDRAFRIGQTKNVQVRKFVCIGTIEEKIDLLIEQKKELADNIVGTGEGWLTELSNKELRQLVALSKDAVSESASKAFTKTKTASSKKALSQNSK
ncbi:MAG: DEAD/DEAH box helicase [Acidobacteria bacterium]|nr:DEAD/DEAH box helicase [Acidobacteriota bacterium]